MSRNRSIVTCLFHATLLAAIAAGGCRSKSEPVSTVAGQQDNAESAAAGVNPEPSISTKPAVPTKPVRDADDSIQLIRADLDIYQQILSKHKGRVVLVDFWATWCAPCKKALPKILGYGQKYAAQGLDVVTVSMDDPESPASALEFLRSVDSKTDNLISKWGASTDSTEQFKIDSALPYYKLYDRQGGLRYQFSGVPEGLDHVEPLDQLKPRLQQLLKGESNGGNQKGT